MHFFVIVSDTLTKILYFDTESSSIPTVAGMSDSKYIDSLVHDNKLVCLGDTGILTIYNIHNKKLMFDELIPLDKNVKWLTQSGEYVLAGSNKSIYKIHLINKTLQNIHMEKTFKQFFQNANNICCSQQNECKNLEYDVVSSTVTTDGTYYLIKKERCSFIIFYDMEYIKCQQIDFDKNVIKIANIGNVVHCFIKTDEGFSISKFTHENGLVTKSFIDFYFPKLTSVCNL